ncbi:hypothetical protein LRY65_04840 [Candidatus Woesebacteria bacterium]|nr:hypothetical protein [Candidatus Woesebacteria bacterium]MCD8506883.1 hypothetical protein [Candidatus Woesebacteria bacterium]MCD8527497.1 hypothetical protein [Candidatus Woesebacteria bacterium]MCD8546238.1 hypothetical protein [Candidatus Woesebacteria bacterium]
MPDLTFRTQVSGKHEGIHFVRDLPQSDLVANSSFAAAVYYMITGRQPDAAQEKVFNAILVASMDHGISPASGFVPRVVASTGNNLVHSMAAGILALGPYHGLAIEDAAKTLVQVKEKGIESLEESHFAPKKRILGLGHPHYKHTDPRTDQLFALARDAGLSTEYQDVMHSVQAAVYERLEKHLVINIDGGIAALLLDLGFPPEAGNALFAMARMGGMIAHVLEEIQKEKPVRRVDESDVHFTPPHISEGSEE